MLDKAINLLKSSIAHHQLVLDAEEHQQVLTQLASYQTTSDNFEQQLNDIYSREAVNENELNQIESMATKLEQEEKTLLTLLTELSKNDSYFTEKHEEDFFVINAILGSCALTLGLLLTVYIVQIIVKRIQNIQQQITIFDVSLNNDDKSSDAKLTINTKDELEELEFDIQLLMSKLSKEIATREQVEKQLLQLVSQDKLTGLYNRHKWDEQIHMHINLAQRGYPFGLIVLDVDYFKKINDQHGHWVGDKLLQSLAQEISKNVRDIDLTFRLGGEEFAVICPMNDTTHLGKVAEELRHAIEKMRIDDLPALTVSIGIAASNVSDTSASIFKRADIALYRAKSQGRNQIINGDIAEDE
ncbi:GGDEF domain-containing protein [Shewanella sp. PP-Sp27a-2]